MLTFRAKATLIEVMIVLAIVCSCIACVCCIAIVGGMKGRSSEKYSE